MISHSASWRVDRQGELSTTRFNIYMERVDRHGRYRHFIANAITMSNFPKNHSFLCPPTHQTLMSPVSLQSPITMNQCLIILEKDQNYYTKTLIKYLFVFACMHAGYMLGDGGTHVSRCVLVCVRENAEGRG